MQITIVSSSQQCIINNDLKGSIQIQTPVHQPIVLQIQSKYPIQFKYQNPYLAFKNFAVMFKEFAIPWQRRIYIEDYLSPIEGNQKKYPPEMFYISDLVNFGAPYTWGGKESLQSISVKLNKNNSVFDRVPEHFQEMVTHKNVMHPVNLDEGESIWDRPKGLESPVYWTGVDCSGLLEQCCYYAGLQWNWRTASVISSGDYRGASSFDQVLPGDVMVLKRNGIVVHFGVISQKGISIPTTSIIHSAWFTNYHYNTNTLQKVTETSLSEFRSVYTWDIVRLSTIE
jgi:cell wall-associated NlpC family hydrolase